MIDLEKEMKDINIHYKVSNHTIKFFYDKKDKLKIKSDLHYFIRRGVKVTFRDDNFWVHFNSEQGYTVFIHILQEFMKKYRYKTTKETIVWLDKMK